MHSSSHMLSLFEFIYAMQFILLMHFNSGPYVIQIGYVINVSFIINMPKYTVTHKRNIRELRFTIVRAQFYQVV